MATSASGLLARSLRFVGVGGFSTIVYWVVMLVLSRVFRGAPTIASVIAYGTGFVASYVGHRTFTYRSSARLRPQLTRFLTVQALCFVAGNLAFWLVTARLGYPVVAGGIALTLVNIIVSYLAFEAWVFKAPEHP